MSVHKKLMQARVKLQGIELSKSGHNKFAGYKYFELGDFLPAIQTIFNELGLCGVVSYNTEYAQLCITDVEDGTVIVITSPMAEANLKGTHPIQNLGAVETYQRRYLWMTALEIVEHDILDASEPVKEVAKPVAKPVAKLANTSAPAKMEGKSDGSKDDGPWFMKVEAEPGTDIAAWLGVVEDAATVALEFAQSKEDVMTIFKKNRNIFDRLKQESEEAHKALMDKFTKAKKQFETAGE